MANMIDIVVNATDRASNAIRGINGSLKSMSDRAERASAITNTALAGIAVGLGAVAFAGISQNKVMEESSARWSTLLKSSEKAEKQMSWMKKFAKTTPFNYESIDQTATALNGMGLEIKDVNKWLPTLGDASAVLGGGSETVKGLGMALGQMNAKGKVSAEEMQQLAERGVNAWGMLADGMGMTQAEVRKLSEDGKLLAKDALPLIQKGMQETFGGGTANLMKSTVGQAMLATENFNLLSGAITSGAYNWFGANVLPMINKGMEALTNVFGGGLLAGFQKLWTSGEKARLVLVGMAGALLSILIPAIIGIVSALAPAVIAFAPFLAVGMAVAGLAYLIYKNWGILAPYFQQLWSTLTSAFNSAKSALATGWNYLIGLWNTFKPVAFDLMRTALDKLKFAFGAVKTVVQAVAQYVSGDAQTSFRTVADYFGSEFANKFWSTISKLHVWFNKLKTIWNTVKDVFVNTMPTFEQVWNALKAGIDKVKEGFNNAKPTFDKVLDGLKAGWNMLKTAFEIAKPIIMSVVDTLVSSFLVLWSQVQPILTQLKSLWDVLKDAFFTALPIIQSVAQVVGVVLFTAFTIAIGIINGVISAIGPLISAVIDVIKFIINLGIAVIKVFQGDFSGAFEFAKKAFGNLMSAIGNIIDTIISFFVGFVRGVWSVIRPFFTDMVAKFKSWMSDVGDKIDQGIGDMISTVVGWVSDFMESGKGLIDGFVKGVKKGFSGAVDAVTAGMKMVRDLLPFSPAKKGPLRDLDKSGKSFFPTWYKGALKQAKPMARAIGGAMGGLNKELSGYGSVGLEAFTGGRSKVTVIHEHKHSGKVDVNGDNSRETVEFVGNSVKTTTENDVMSDLRRITRSR